jgi:hypothetical protein
MKGDSIVNETQKVTLFLNPKLHALMKEYAKRHRIHLGLAYDNAVQVFLSSTNQFMGKKRTSQLKGVQTNG